MGNEVYANGMEIACKSGNAKVIAAFPDVCLSPPPPPAGPVPIPYPVTSMASDTTDGSRTVKISGNEVMLKDKSAYKKCVGDEAATKAQGMGVITHSIGGKTTFAAWSPDVKIEGENADRHLDITNSNGQSNSNQLGMVNFDAMTFDKLSACDGVSEDYRLVPYYDKRSKGTLSCPDPTTGHHLVPGHLMGAHGKKKKYTEGNGKCHHNTAPVACALGKNQHGRGSHGRAHADSDLWEGLIAQSGSGAQYPYSEALDNGTRAAGIIVDGKPLEPGEPAWDCVRAQLDDYFEKCGIAEDHNFSPSSSGLNTSLMA